MTSLTHLISMFILSADHVVVPAISLPFHIPGSGLQSDNIAQIDITYPTGPSPIHSFAFPSPAASSLIISPTAALTRSASCRKMSSQRVHQLPTLTTATKQSPPHNYLLPFTPHIITSTHQVRSRQITSH